MTLQDIKVYIVPNNIPHCQLKKKVWEKKLPDTGATIVKNPSDPGITHVLCGSPLLRQHLPRALLSRIPAANGGADKSPSLHNPMDSPDNAALAVVAKSCSNMEHGNPGVHQSVSGSAPAKLLKQISEGSPGHGSSMGAASSRGGAKSVRVVSYMWLEACLREQQRLAESAFEVSFQTGWQVPKPGPVSIVPHRVELQDVQRLLLWLLAGWPSVPWVTVVRQSVQRVVLLLLSGLSQEVYKAHKASLPVLSSLGKASTLYTPGSVTHPVQADRALLSVLSPLKRQQLDRHPPLAKRPRIAEGGPSQQPTLESVAATATQLHADTAVTATAAADEPSTVDNGLSGLHRFVASWDQMRSHGYPIPALAEDKRSSQGPCANEWTTPTGYVLTGPSTAGQQAVVAIDCEMCYTADGLKLTRMSLVDGDGQVLADMLVRPSLPVTDYNTTYSGITADMLRGVVTTLEDAQREFCKHVGCRTVLVGHTLENDLQALQMVHGRCVDTAMLFPLARTPPAKASLKRLAKDYLDLDFQQGAHDSVEDARVALQLVKQKLRHGAPWPWTPAEKACSLLQLLLDASRACDVIGPAELICHSALSGARTSACANDGTALRRFCDAMRGAQQRDRQTEAQSVPEEGEKVVREDAVYPSSAFPTAVNKPADLTILQLQQLHLFWAQSCSNTVVPQVDCLCTSCANQASAAATTGTVGSAAGCALAGVRDAAPPSVATVDDTLRRLDTGVQQVVKACPPGTFIVVCGGIGNSATVLQLESEKQQLQYSGGSALQQQWSQEKQQRLLAARTEAALTPVLCHLVPPT